MKEGPDSWEAAYRKRPTSGYGEAGHHPRAPSLASLFSERNVTSILDLGCGDGGNLVFFAEQGFAVSGLDYAPTALRLAREWLAREALEGDLRSGDMRDLPWPADTFDAVISVKVINHNTAAGVEATIAEVKRVLRPGGYFFATVASHPPPERWFEREPVEVEPRTYVPALGHDKGVPHHFFTEDEVRHLLDGFEVLELVAERSIQFLARNPGY
ncbi:MAG: class I SAM-dependent methyltransferase [Candidatus Brocadiia bacterium]